MKLTTLKVAVLAALALGSTQAMAQAGFNDLPLNAAAATAAGTAYLEGNTSGQYGWSESLFPFTDEPVLDPNTGLPTGAVITHNDPLDPVNNLALNIAGDTAAPLAGYVQVQSTNRSATVRSAITNNQTVTVASVVDQAWRGPFVSGTSGPRYYIFRVRFTLNGNDVVRTGTGSAGVQTFEVNDIAHAGFNGKPVAFAYDVRGNTDEVVFRAGRTYDSAVAVQEFPDVPLALPDLAAAPFKSNWALATTDLNFADPDGTSPKDSPWFAWKTTSAAAPIQLAKAIELRESGQEGQPVITSTLTGWSPSGSNVTNQ
jgi:hypothetical protein